jgi:hypothetical protein
MKKTLLLISFFLFMGVRTFTINAQTANSSERKIIDIDFTSEIKTYHIENLEFTDRGLQLEDDEKDGCLLSKKIKIPIKNVSHFLSFSSGAIGQNINLTTIQFYIRASVNGKDWENWVKIKSSEHGETRSDLFQGSLLSFDKKNRYIQYSILFSVVEGVSPIIQQLSLNFFNPGNQRNNLGGILDLHTPTSDFSSVTCPCPQPPYFNRTNWGCPDGQNPSCNNPEYSDVSHLIVHHSAGSNSSSNWAATVLSIWNYHTSPQPSGNGWCDIGYNWLIDPDGILYEGRGGGDNVVGAHFSCANSNTMGVCLLGNFTTLLPAALAYNSLTKLLAWKSCAIDSEPLGNSFHYGTQLNLDHISGHKDANPSQSPNACTSGTQCPGNAFYPQLSQLRNDVNNLINSPNCESPMMACNNCSSPCNLNSNTSCNWSNQNLLGASQSIPSQASCDGYSGNANLADVWFEFEAEGPQTTIQLEPQCSSNTPLDLVVAIYTSPCGGSEIACEDPSGYGDVTINLNNLNVGSTYYIRAYDYGGVLPLCGDFKICVTHINPCNNFSISANAIDATCQNPNGSASAFASGGSAPYNYSWSNGMSGAFISGLLAGNYSVTATDANGCSATTSVTVGNVGIPPSQPIISGIPTFCEGEYTTLMVSNPCSGCTYNWSNGSSGTSTNINNGGAYTVTAHNNCGTSTSNSFSVSENPLPTQPIISGELSFCQGQPAAFTISNPCSGCTYSWSNGDSGISTTISTGGSYSVTAQNTCGISSNNFIITVYPPPNVIVNANPPEITQGNSSTLNAVGGVSYQWHNNYTGASISVYPMETTTYTVTVTDSNNCTGTGEVEVKVVPTGIEEIPVLKSLLLSPNPNQGTFQVELELQNSEKIQMRLFNTIGQLMFATNPLESNGKHIEQIALASATPGVYFLQLQIGKHTITERVIIEK